MSFTMNYSTSVERMYTTRSWYRKGKFMNVFIKIRAGVYLMDLIFHIKKMNGYHDEKSDDDLYELSRYRLSGDKPRRRISNTEPVQVVERAVGIKLDVKRSDRSAPSH